MRALVTLGPTYESLDEVRRLTNFSTGRLGSELSNSLAEHGCRVTALRGYYATAAQILKAEEVHPFTTTEHLLNLLIKCSRDPYEAVFHAAAVSDFKFGRVFERGEEGELRQVSSGKFSTRSGTLLAELVPTPKIIGELRGLFPNARIFGWKYEVEGDRESVLAAAERQLRENKTDFCVVNGPAYGEGFRVLSRSGEFQAVRDSTALFETLFRLISR
jgi:phosphopantothenoylcysteine synthetase/decarboxylase